MAEDVALERLQLGRRVEAQLVGQHPPGVPVRGERVGLAPAAVERQHQLRAQRLAQRMLPDQRLQLGHQLGMTAEGEVGLDALTQARQAQLLEALSLAGGEWLVAHVLQRRAPPEPERVGQQPARVGVVAARERVAPLGGHALEPARVNGVGVGESQLVALCPPRDRLLAQHAAQARDDALERVRRMLGQRLAPQRVDRDVRRRHPDAVDEQQREQLQRAAGAAERAALGSDRFDGPKDPVLQL